SSDLSLPPWTMWAWLPTASRMSAGQSIIGGIDSAAGRASRTMAVGARWRRSMTALVKWVVPIITPEIMAGSTPPESRTVETAVTMPPVTSAVVGVLQVACTVVPCMRTASVLVPPTSIPMRIIVVGAPIRVSCSLPSIMGRVARRSTAAARFGEDRRLTHNGTSVTSRAYGCEGASVTWIVTTDHLDALEIGAGILGTGGGGNPYLGKLIARRFVEEGARIEIVDPDEVPDDAVVVSVGGMGSPTVSIERLRRADESVRALRALERHTGTRVTHLVPSEIGGSNSTTPMVVAAQCGLPVIDGDGMGRAFPELQMETFVMYGVTPTPAALCNHHGHIAIFDAIDDATTLERYARAVTIQMGGSAGYAFPLMTGRQTRQTVIRGTLSLAIRLGEAVLAARRDKTDPVAAVCDVTGGQRLFTGKVTDVERRMTGRFARA